MAPAGMLHGLKLQGAGADGEQEREGPSCEESVVARERCQLLGSAVVPRVHRAEGGQVIAERVGRTAVVGREQTAQGVVAAQVLDCRPSPAQQAAQGVVGDGCSAADARVVVMPVGIPPDL